MKFKGVVFDLDGTLLDTLEDLGNCMNSVLQQLGFAPHPVEEYRFCVGDARGIRPALGRVDTTLRRRAANAGGAEPAADAHGDSL